MDNTADMITRIRNAIKAEQRQLTVIYSKKNVAILNILKSEGYIEDLEVLEVRKNIKEIVVTLKYKQGVAAIRNIKIRSKQQRREYSAIADLAPIRNGLGIAVLSTSQGIISDFDARQKNIGGEIICEVF